MTSKPKILFVCTQMEAAGVQGRATAMLNGLLAEGTDAALLFLYTKRPVFDGMASVSSLSASRPTNPLALIAIFMRLVLHVRRTKPTAIVGFAHYASPLAALAGQLNGVPIRIASQTNTPTSHGYLARTLDWLCGTFGVYTDNIAVSETIESMFERYPAGYRARLKTVLNGVTPPTPRMDQRGGRASFGLPDKFTIVNCGRLSRAKNQKALLRIVERLPDVHLVIIGEGELRSDLQSEITERGLQSRVTLVGEVPSSQVPEYLNCGDIFVFPSLHEGFPVALLEAMQVGLPIIVSDHPAVVEAVGEAGPTLSPDDTDRWVQAIKYLRDNVDARVEAARASTDRGRMFTFEKMLAQYRQLWTSEP